MIIVPIEENHSGLASATDAEFRTPDMSGSGLEALGAGLAKLGDGGQQVATALDEKRRRELAAEIAAAHLDDHHRRNLDDAAAKKAYVDYSDQSTAMLHGENGILNHAGAEAHAAFPTLVAALADAHDEAMAPLDSVQRSVVGPALGERLRGDVARAAAHVRQQGEVEQQVQSRALQTVAARDAVADADQPDLHDHHMATGENAIRQQAMIGGTPDDERDQQLADYRSGVHADTIEALSARDPASAADWYGRFGNNLNEADKRRVATMLAPVPGDGQIALDDTIAGTSGNPISLYSDEGAESALASDRNLSEVVVSPDQTPAPSPSPATTGPRPSPGEAASGVNELADRRATSRSFARWLYDASDSEAKEDRSQYDIGILSRQYETTNRGPGSISVPAPGDTGGKSYGSYQLASEKGQVAAFLASDGRKWAPEFNGLIMHDPDFDKKWREIGARDAAAFSRAQATFIKRQDYNPVVDRIFEDSKIDLRTRSSAVRNAVFSTVTQMGPGVPQGDGPERGGVLVIRRAVDRTLAVSQPSDADFDQILVNKIYDARVEFANKIIDHNIKISTDPKKSPQAHTDALKKVKLWRSIIAHRYKDERRDALGILAEEIKQDSNSQ